MCGAPTLFCRSQIRLWRIQKGTEGSDREVKQDRIVPVFISFVSALIFVCSCGCCRASRGTLTLGSSHIVSAICWQVINGIDLGVFKSVWLLTSCSRWVVLFMVAARRVMSQCGWFIPLTCVLPDQRDTNDITNDTTEWNGNLTFGNAAETSRRAGRWLGLMVGLAGNLWPQFIEMLSRFGRWR
jgi:hypothetical protein